ncbi:MAG: hypothetical protein Kow00106_09140 [Anaerolineae bacterium]
MSIPSDLDRLPPQAVAVLRYLATRGNAEVSIAEIMGGAGLSNVGVGKGIRPLVTRRYVTMTQPGHYVLTPAGREVARGLLETEQAVGEPSAQAQTKTQRSERVHVRRLSAFAPCELSLDTPSSLQVGFDPPDQGQPPLPGPWRLVLRLRADGCEVSPESCPLDLQPRGVSGPVRFRVIPQAAGKQRFRLEVLDVGTGGNSRLLGGMYFDLNVAEFPTPACAEFQALGASVTFPLAGEDAP